MSDEKTSEEASKEDTKAEAVEEQKKSKIDLANEAAERAEKATTALKAENDRSEQLKSDEILSGNTTAGQAVEEETRTPEEIASRKRIKAVADVTGAAWGKKYE